MYTEQEVRDAQEDRKKYRNILWIALALCVAGMVVFFLLRLRYVTMGWTIAALSTVMLLFDIGFWPRNNYSKFITNLYQGRKHTEEGAFKSAEEHRREDIPCVMWTLTDEEGDEFVVYLDAKKNWPAPAEGERLKLEIYEHFVFSC